MSLSFDQQLVFNTVCIHLIFIHIFFNRESCRRVFRTGITHEEWSVEWNKEDE